MSCLLLLTAFNFLIQFSNGIHCRDPLDQVVDWFFIYKLPKQQTHDNELIRKGLAFMYLTSTNDDQWIFSSISINDSTSLVAHTLRPIFNKNKENLYLLYNDQPPYGHVSPLKGHTKGVVLANSTAGLWLIHSVPHFPYNQQYYEYPLTGTHFGQSFLCISLTLDSLNNVGLQLQYNEPHLFAQNLPGNLVKVLPEIYKAAKNETVTQAPWYRVTNLSSQANTTFLSFAKSRKFKKDLYADLVNSVLQENLYVETWPNEPNRLPSNCDHKFEVDNVLSVSIKQFNISFNNTVDHSKWAVSTGNISANWICIGDINRAKRQTNRGGGTTCFGKSTLANHYLNIINSVQHCEN
ncbi:hypothetical protein ABEB36_003865 [Hypothenemus hampei]|uniref:Plancitoxin-1 n=1 Tax=Hypothenemus hampei TaxID=57062 RepID=A0ABD1F1E3_HYPHA